MILNDCSLCPIVVLNIYQSDVLTALFGCYMVGAMWNYYHLSTSSLYTVQPCTSLQYHFIQTNQSHIGTQQGACVFSCNMPPSLLAKWPGSFTRYCGNTGMEQILKWVSTESWPRRRKCSCFQHAGNYVDILGQKCVHMVQEENAQREREREIWGLFGGFSLKKVRSQILCIILTS